MLNFLDLLAAEIQFFMMFRFSLVYVSVFGNRLISSLWKILKSLITPYEELVVDFWGQFWTFRFFYIFELKSHFLKSKDRFDHHPPTHPTIKVFEVSKKADPRWCFWKFNFGFSITYKMERVSSGPHWVRSAVPFGGLKCLVPKFLVPSCV